MIEKIRTSGKKPAGRRKPSLTIQMMAVMVLLVLGLIGSSLFVNNTYLEKFYQYHKRQEMMEGLNIMDQASGKGIICSESFDVPFEKLCAEHNISMFVMDSTGRRLLRASMNNSDFYQTELMEILFQSMLNNVTVLEQDDQYVLARRVDARLGSEYLIILATLKEGEMVYMRTPLESIRESALVTNRFLTMMGVLLIAVSVVISYFLARTMSQPIRELTNLSRRMSDLNFEVRYEDKAYASREISELGSHMNQLSATLEHTISELKVANNELKQDIQKKEKIDEMRKEFLSNVSHELKTPIALISGYAEGLKECINDDPESRDFYCDVILDESEKMNNMVKKLLTLNQLEFGRAEIEMERFDITEVISGLVAAQMPLASANGIDIKIDAESPTYVWADTFGVEEVLSNYLSNALHHVKGEKQIRISCTKAEDHIRISVFNTGDPIPEEELEKIWIKFYKVDKARTREYGGSGIGLSIVKATMEAMHQPFGVANHEDGVEFWIELEAA